MDNTSELLWNALDHIPIGIFVLDAAGNYLYVNEEYCRSVHKPKAFFDGMSIPKLKALGYLTTNVWEQVMEKRQPVVSVISVTDEQLSKTYDTFTVGIPMLDANGNIQQIVYRQEPVDELTQNLQTGMLNKHLFRRSSPEVEDTPENLIYQSPQMKQIVSMLTAVSKTDVSILVTGASGTGKEVLANHIHRVSDRNQGPLVTINCAAIPESLLESELFGYAKGAFTGAAKDGKPGLIEAAAGGTLFLDEINSMPLPLQRKLLRVLETRQVTRLGSVSSREIDFRLVCASNEDLQTLVDQKLFRSDLFYRINVISVSIPPLCERKEDILPLATHFIEFFCKKYGRVKVLSETAIQQLLHHDWPGNVRELRNTIERVVVMSPDLGGIIPSIPINRPRWETRSDPPSPAILTEYSEDAEDFSLKAYMDRCEKELLEQLLSRHRSVSKVARLLKIDQSNIYRKLHRHELPAPRP